MHDEGLLWVPLIVRVPGNPAESVNGDLVSALDLSATISDYAGVEAILPQQGSSRRGLLNSGFAKPDYAINERSLSPTRTEFAPSLRTVRTRTQ